MTDTLDTAVENESSVELLNLKEHFSNGAMGFRHHKSGLVEAFEATKGPDVSGINFEATQEVSQGLAQQLIKTPGIDN